MTDLDYIIAAALVFTIGPALFVIFMLLHESRRHSKHKPR